MRYKNILNQLSIHGELSKKGIAEKTGISQHEVGNVLMILIYKKKIDQIRKDTFSIKEAS